MMAVTLAADTARPGARVMMTDALVGTRSRTKTLCLGEAKCTRALLMPAIWAMLRDSSCSMALL